MLVLEFSIVVRSLGKVGCFLEIRKSHHLQLQLE